MVENNPYTKFVEEFKDVVTEEDLRDFKRDRFSYATRFFFTWAGFLLAAIAVLISALISGNRSLSWGIASVILGVAVLWTVSVGRELFPSLEGEYYNYLIAKRKIKEKP